MISRSRPSFTFGDLAAGLRAREDGEARRALAASFGAFVGADDVLLTPSGRAGLYAILRAVDRARVVVPAYTCNAVVEAARLAGKVVEFVEVESDGFNVDPAALGPSLGPDAVFVATHQFGIPCDIARTVDVCRERGAMVVEDCAASLGTTVGGRQTGTFGDAAFYSFDMSKLITVPAKGGAVVVRDPALAAEVRAAHAASVSPMPSLLRARFFAMGAALRALQEPHAYRAFHSVRFERKGTFTAEAPLGEVTRGVFYRYDLTDGQAVVASRQLARVGDIIAERRRLYAEYERRLRAARSFDTPPPDALGEWAPIRFPIRVRGDKLAFYRAAARRGVDFAFSFTFIEAPRRFAAAHRLADAVLDLPFYPGLTRREVDHVVETLLAVDEAFTRAAARASVTHGDSPC
jgi:dTDP-4-amino-4,6-dideoxygalactose transaminase